MIQVETVLTGIGVGNMGYEHLQAEGAPLTFCGLAPAADQAAERARREDAHGAGTEIVPCPACRSLLQAAEAAEAKGEEP